MVLSPYEKWRLVSSIADLVQGNDWKRPLGSDSRGVHRTHHFTAVWRFLTIVRLAHIDFGGIHGFCVRLHKASCNEIVHVLPCMRKIAYRPSNVTAFVSQQYYQIVATLLLDNAFGK